MTTTLSAILAAAPAFAPGGVQTQTQTQKIDFAGLTEVLLDPSPLLSSDDLYWSGLYWSGVKVARLAGRRSELDAAFRLDPAHPAVAEWPSRTLVNTGRQGLSPIAQMRITRAEPLTMDRTRSFQGSFQGHALHSLGHAPYSADAADGTTAGPSRKVFRLLTEAPENPDDPAFLNAVHVASAAKWHGRRASGLPRAKRLSGEGPGIILGPGGDGKTHARSLDDVKARVPGAALLDGFDPGSDPAGGLSALDPHTGQAHDDAPKARAADEPAKTGMSDRIPHARPFFRHLSARPPMAVMLAELCDWRRRARGERTATPRPGTGRLAQNFRDGPSLRLAWRRADRQS